MDKLKFSPEAGFLDSASFPDPSNETETRTQLQNLHSQTRDYINNMLTMYGADAIKFRINATKNLEFTVDDVNWEEIVGRGERGPVGPGVAEGGTQGQILLKNSAANYDTAWGDMPIATDSLVGGAKVKGSTNSTMKVDVDTLKVNQLSIPTLEVVDAPVQTLTEPEWWDEEGEYTKYIEVLVDGCVETAKPDHIVMTTAFGNLCKMWKALDGKIRFILSNDAGATISTTLKEIIIQYQD